MTKIDSVTPITVRQAELSDIEAVIPLLDAYRQFYGRSSDLNAARKFLTDRFTQSESVIFIAYHAGTAVGFTQLYPSFSSVSLGRIFILNDLFVIEQARRIGVASRLLATAVEFSRNQSAVRVSLSTAIENEKAQQLYQSAGWKRDAQFFYYHFVI
jgi:ribosomal protein S18 acetylase RimI-like enzyme